MKKDAIFLRGHKNNRELEDAYNALKNVNSDVYIVFDATDKKPLTTADHVINFTIEDYKKSGYPIASFSQIYELPTAPPLNSLSKAIYYNPEYAQIIAMKELDKRKKEYENYWYIEYDVAFSGDWQHFFNLCKPLKQDLACIMLRQYPVGAMFEKFWEQITFDVTDNNKFAFFGTIWRGSRKLLETLDKEYLKGKHAFYEIAVPTLAVLNKLSVTDLNSANNGKPLYTPITMNGKFVRSKWTPELLRSSQNMLFHPFTFAPQTLLFATSYLSKEDDFKRYEEYIIYYKRNLAKLGARQIAFIDDGSNRNLVEKFISYMNEFHSIDIEFIDNDNLPDKVLPNKILWFAFKDNLGRPSLTATTGWWRSFSFSHIIARKYGFDKLIHIESDSYVFTDRIFTYLKNANSGWNVMYSDYYNFADTCIQVINRDNYKGLEIAYEAGEALWKKALSNSWAIAEFILPFTNVIKCFKGDRYGDEVFWNIDDDVDYATNMSNINTVGIFEPNIKNKIEWLENKLYTLEPHREQEHKARLREKYTVAKAEPEKDINILFATSFMNHELHVERYVNYIRYYINLKRELNIDKIVLIDDGSKSRFVHRLYMLLQDNYNITIEHFDSNNLPDKLPEISLISFSDNLGRPEYFTTAGWFRSFSFSYVLTQKYDVNKLVHVESDFYLLSEKIFSWVRDNNEGWHSQYCELHNMAETAIQIINKDVFHKLSNWWTGGKRMWFIGREKPYRNIAENLLPIDYIHKNYDGDRYGEKPFATIPLCCDYVGQTSNIQSFNDDFLGLENKINGFNNFIKTKMVQAK